MSDCAKPFFSLLVPCYNMGSYVGECVSSLMAQTFQDWEAWLIDDGSIDNTGALFDGFAAADPERIHVIHQDNKGLLTARRVALSHAQGRYVVHVDADDALRADALELIHQQAMAHPGAIVKYGYSRCPDFSVYDNPPYPEDEEYPVVKDIQWLRWLVAGSDLFHTMWSCATPIELSGRDLDYSKYAGVVRNEDFLQFVVTLDRAREVVVVREPLYFYRDNPTSLVHTFDPTFFYSAKTAHQELCSKLEEWGSPELRDRCLSRWAHISMLAVHNAKQSNYGYWQMYRELRRIGQDRDFREAIERGLAKWDTPDETLIVQMEMMERREYLPLAIKLVKLCRQR